MLPNMNRLLSQAFRKCEVGHMIPLTLPPIFFRRASSWSIMPAEVVSTILPNCTWGSTRVRDVQTGCIASSSIQTSVGIVTFRPACRGVWSPETDTYEQFEGAYMTLWRPASQAVIQPAQEHATPVLVPQSSRQPAWQATPDMTGANRTGQPSRLDVSQSSLVSML